MSEWKVSELCQIIGGGTPKTSVPEYWNGDICWLSVKDFSGDRRYVYESEKKITELGLNNSSTKLLQKDDIIISARGTVGEMAMIPFPMAFNQSCFGLRGNEKVDKTFLFYLLKTKIKTLKKQANGAVFDTINISTFNNIVCTIPSLETQKKIANFLSEIDDKIENNRKICANLEAQAQALFKHWFIDFAPFKDGKFVESELGMIPEGWRVGKLGEIAEVSSGKRPIKRFDTETKEHNVPLVGASCVMGYTNEAFMSKKILLTGRVGTLGVIQRFNRACWPSDNTLVITTQFYEFVYQILKTLNYIGMNRGTSQPLITQGDLKKTFIIIPPDEIVNEFEDTSSKLMSILEQKDKESKITSTLRDTILPKLMSGAIKV